MAEHAAGPLGAARIAARLPDTDAVAIRDALAQVAELAALLITDESIQAEPVPDIAPSLELLAVPGSVLEALALAELAVALAAMRVVAAELKRLITAHGARLTAHVRVDPPPKDLETKLVQSISPAGEVLDGASKDLARARAHVREARKHVMDRLGAILGALDQTDRAPDAAVTLRGGRYVIPIRSTARSRVGGIVHDESATRSTLFVEPPEIIELGNELRAAEAAEQREVLRVLRELTDALRPHAAAIAAAWEMCIAFDDLCARAKYAVEVNGFVPEIGGHLKIRNGRHPLLSAPPDSLSVPERGDVVPFDLELFPDEFTVLISGPNTGGKTVLIKAVGLLALLAQSGIIPPIGPHSSLPVFTEVFADIGDRQSIAASLSTFSAHVAELRDILEGAGPGSLVLLDEIGSGTDPAEGGALASATLKTLTRRRAVTMATTHLGALKQLAAETVGIVNASLQFDAETLTPTYRLLKGVPGRSYGLAIAKRLGIPSEVLAEAERAVPDAERTLDKLLASVEARGRAMDDRAAELENRAAQLELERQNLAELETLGAELQAKEKALDKAAREQARAYLLEARKTVEAALAQARAAVTEATAKEARRIVEEAIEKTDANEEKKSGWVNLEELRRRKGGLSSPSPERRGGQGERTETQTETEISLRGLTIEEAEPLLARAIDDAVLGDLPYLRIIHGKGTGVLREFVQGVVKRDKRIKRFAFAPANQGGNGVTVVEFK
ncbi:MAG TPA: Smr/MutS family protein [Gemmatimonadales bacterium]|nr:Smr/MutS family protein [Gemmatimonadales bacterium]